MYLKAASDRPPPNLLTSPCFSFLSLRRHPRETQNRRAKGNRNLNFQLIKERRQTAMKQPLYISALLLFLVLVVSSEYTRPLLTKQGEDVKFSKIKSESVGVPAVDDDSSMEQLMGLDLEACVNGDGKCFERSALASLQRTFSLPPPHCRGRLASQPPVALDRPLLTSLSLASLSEAMVFCLISIGICGGGCVIGGGRVAMNDDHCVTGDGRLATGGDSNGGGWAAGRKPHNSQGYFWVF